jgi:cytochrome c-type biogenesis protein CcmH
MNPAAPPGRTRIVLPGLLVLLAVLAAGLTLAIVAASGRGAGTSQARQVQQIAAGLHCPVCKDLSAADSPAPLAQQMRQQIAQKLSAGESGDQIRAGFVAAYGESVLMSPPHRGLAQMAYYLPVLVVVFGLGIALLLLRRWCRPVSDLPGEPAASPLSASERRGVQMALGRLREEEPG